MVGIVNLWLLLPNVFMFLFFFKLSKIYIATARIVKRLESTSNLIYNFYFEDFFKIETLKKCSSKSDFYSRFFFTVWSHNFESSPTWFNLSASFQSVSECTHFCLLHLYRHWTMVWYPDGFDYFIVLGMHHLYLHSSTSK